MTKLQEVSSFLSQQQNSVAKGKWIPSAWD